LLNFRKNPTGGVSIEMAEPIECSVGGFLILKQITYRVLGNGLPRMSG
jgi:hypothetical protein